MLCWEIRTVYREKGAVQRGVRDRVWKLCWAKKGYGWCMWELVLHRVEMGGAVHGEKESVLCRVRQKWGGGGWDE